MDFQPGYVRLLEENLFQERIDEAKKQLSNCSLCPRNCGVDRASNRGFCQAGDVAVVSSFGPHYGEEKVLVGRRGSGTIFFGYCNLRCVYCQNHELSFKGAGRPLSNEQLAEVMLILQNRHGCPNINLVTPTHYLPNILEAVYLAAQEGLRLPLVYNCGGYESLASLRLLAGVVDIYMPDFKYNSGKRSLRYSDAENYPQVAREALREMDRQVGGLKTDQKGLAQRGLLLRHLVLPCGLDDTKEILRFIKDELSAGTLVNVMGQYHPCHQAFQYPEISRRLGRSEFREALRFARDLDLRLA
ncbi:MAG: radical SAM protein [Firmicutes bacterium]|nr:radical SAM protein [Bacillota bacterium]